MAQDGPGVLHRMAQDSPGVFLEALFSSLVLQLENVLRYSTVT